MKYAKDSASTFIQLSDELAAQLSTPEFYEKSTDIPEHLWGTRRRAELLEEDSPEVQEFFSRLVRSAKAAERTAALKAEASAIVATTLGLSDEQAKALFQ